MAGLSPYYQPYPGTEDEPDMKYGLGVAQNDMQQPSDNFDLGIDEPTEENIEAQSVAPKATDTQRGLADYMANWANKNITQGNEAYEKNRVNQEDVDAAREQNKTRQLLAGLAESGAKIGNYRGNYSKSSLPEFANQMQQDDKQYFDQKRQASQAGLAQAQEGRRALADVGAFKKRIAEMDNMVAKNDPNSEISKSMRDAVRSSGMEIPDNLSAAAIEKVMPQARQIALEKMRQEYGMKLEGIRSRDRRSSDDARRELADAKTQQNQDKDKRDTEIKLRKEFANNKTVQTYNQIKPVVDQIQNLSDANSGAADQAIVYVFNKALDPGSVVREAEFANAAGNAGLVTKAQMYQEKLFKGEFLSPQQKKDMRETAKQLVDALGKHYDDVVADYDADAEYYGLNPERVMGRSAFGKRNRNPNQGQGPVPEGTAAIEDWKPNRTAVK